MRGPEQNAMSAPVGFANRDLDVLVVGGGPAGSMAALRLAQAGRRVTLIEREHAPHHKVCGEFLSQEAIAYLSSTGIFPHELGAVPIHSLRLFAGARSAETELPFTALSLSRRTLDAALLDRAADAGCIVMRGTCVERLVPEGSEWIARLPGTAAIRAQTVFLATGKHDLHGWSRGRGDQNDLIGFKMHWRLTPAQAQELRGWMELFLFEGGYGGLSLVEDAVANLCFVIKRSAWRNQDGWNGLLHSLLDANRGLRKRVAGAQPLWDRPLAIAPIPYGYLRPPSSGPWCIGDQAAVIPSFTGDGMSIALHSASLAAHLFLAGATANAYHLALATQLRHSMTLATWISRAMVSRSGRRLALLGTSLLPVALRWIAASTRVPAHALLTGHRA
jgi:flavin-dependent dehydrogenase